MRDVGNALRRWQSVGDVGNASATLAMRRWQCVGDVGNASATLAMRRRRWQCVGDVGVGDVGNKVCSQYVCEVGSQYNTSARLAVNTLLTLVMRRRRWRRR